MEIGLRVLEYFYILIKVGNAEIHVNQSKCVWKPELDGQGVSGMGKLGD